MKHLLVLISLVSSSFISSLAFAGGGNTDSPSVQSLAYIGCSDPQFAKHLNPNRLSVSGSKSIATGARLPIGLVSQFTRPSAGGGGGFTDLVVESPNTFIGEFGNSSKAQIRIEFLPGSVARATIAEASGLLTTFNLTCTAFLTNGTPPSRLGTDMSLGTVEDALKILQN